MVSELEIKIPTSYADITLKKWIQLQKELKSYEDDEEAVVALLLMHLCNLPAEYLKGLAVDDYNMIKNELGSFLQQTDLPLQQFITIDGIEYGFEPNLGEMSYGAYSDITKFKDIQIDDNWAKIMAILYRPVDRKVNKKYYSIKPYTGNIDSNIFLDVPMDVHFGALFFLFNLLTDLLKDTLKSTMEMELPPNIKPILQRSGAHMLQLLSSPIGTLPNSIALLKSR
jgi:hypothetical protein